MISWLSFCNDINKGITWAEQGIPHYMSWLFQRPSRIFLSQYTTLWFNNSWKYESVKKQWKCCVHWLEDWKYESVNENTNCHEVDSRSSLNLQLRKNVVQSESESCTVDPTVFAIIDHSLSIYKMVNTKGGKMLIGLSNWPPWIVCLPTNLEMILI